MAKVPVKVGSFSATTSGTVTLVNSGQPNAGIGGFGTNYWLEVTGISSGSALTTSGAAFKWVSPGGNALTVASISAGVVTSTTNSQILTFASSFVDATKRVAPHITTVQVTFQTSGATNGISCDLYLIPCD